MNSESHSPKEFTVVAFILGLILAIVMCAANTYLGLFAGLTVAASIPAAVISMGILKGLNVCCKRKGTILENNVVQTMASTGESLAAGAIFTMPALVITGVWSEFNYWTVTMVAMCGGILGVIFMIPVRRILIVDDSAELTYPEGVACAEVLKAGDEGGSGVLYVALAVLVGIVFKFFTSGVKLIEEAVEKSWTMGNSLFYFGCNMSPALMAVGYIVRMNVASLVFLGGLIGWAIGIPIMSAQMGLDVSSGNLLDHAWTLWSKKVRYIGVGTMVIGGIWSIYCIRSGIVSGLKQTFRMMSRSHSTNNDVPRTDRDMDMRSVMVLFSICCLCILVLYIYLAQSLAVGVLSTAVMVVAAFFFVAVSSYIVGLVGSSNNPISGMTICTVLFASGLMLLLGYSGTLAIVATLGIAGVVCCAAATAGDVSQDLKTGQLVGATPRAQQWSEVIGAIAPAFILAPVLTLLHSAYGIGTNTPGSLTAPQASLFASITEAMFLESSQLPWDMIIAGVIIGVGLIIFNEVCIKKQWNMRTHVMPVAVGIYLPLAMSAAIFVGGVINFLVHLKLKNSNPDVERGVLFSSGLIAGEALTGILVAVPIVLMGGKGFPINMLDVYGMGPSIPSLIAFVSLCWLLHWVAVRNGGKSQSKA